MSDNEIYSLIKYIKSVLWRVAKRLSYIEDARCLKVKPDRKRLYQCVTVPPPLSQRYQLNRCLHTVPFEGGNSSVSRNIAFFSEFLSQSGSRNVFGVLDCRSFPLYISLILINVTGSALPSGCLHLVSVTC